MLDHVIVFKPLADLDAQGERELFAQLSRLGELPGVLDFALGRNVGSRSRGFDICMRVTFADEAALDAYEKHPVHLDVVAYNRAVTVEHLCVDFPWEQKKEDR
jgi:hypothetical protein